MPVKFGVYRLYPAERRLERDGISLPIGSRAFDLLELLLENAGNVVSKKDLMARAWPETTVDEVSLRVHISALRQFFGKANGDTPSITNVSGRGYMLSLGVGTWSTTAKAQAKVVADEHRLPPAPTRMIGRDAARLEVGELLEARRFVTVVGAGGMGKTTLAVAVAHELLPKMKDHAVFVDLAPILDSALVSTTLASLLGVTTSAEYAVDAICNFLKDKNILLVLDNCEHVINVVAALAETIYKHCPAVCLLATSREALRVEGEYIHKIASLEYPASAGNIEEDTYAAVRLFLDRHIAAGGNPIRSQEELTIASEICRRLDGMALAIELAAGRSASHGLGRTLELLDQRFGIHWAGRRTALPRHQTIQALHDWSYNLLEPGEKSVFRRIGYISGSFTLGASEAVVGGDVEHILEALADKSLLSRVLDDLGDLRYRMAETTRAYALERLRTDERECETVARSHALYFNEFMEACNARAATFHLTGIGRTSSDTLSNIRSALNWCFNSGGDRDLGCRLTANASPLFLELSLLAECFGWTDTAISSLPALLVGTLTEAKLHQGRAVSGIIVEDVKAVVEKSFERALSIAEERGDLRLQLDTLAGQHIFVMRGGDCERGSGIADEAERLCEGSSDRLSVELALCMKGISRAYSGDTLGGIAYLERGCPVDIDLNLNLVVFTQFIRARVQLARLQLFRGLGTLSVSTGEGAISRASAYGHPIPRCIALAYTASTAVWVGDFAVAETALEALTAVSEHHSLTAFKAVSWGLSIELGLRQGDAFPDVLLLQRAIETMKSRNHEHMVVSMHSCLAEANLVLGRIGDALAEAERGLRAAQLGGERFQVSDLLRVRSAALVRRAQPGDMERASQGLLDALDMATSSGNILFELNTLYAMKDFGPNAVTDAFETALSMSAIPRSEVETYRSLAVASTERLIGPASHSALSKSMKNALDRTS